MNATERRVIEQECRDLVCALVHHSDRNDGREVALLFEPTARWTRAGKLRVGRAAILESYVDPASRSPTEILRHFATMTRVVVDSDTQAHAVTYYLVYRFDPGSPEAPLPLPLERPFSAGEWHDRFVLTEEGWRFTTRETQRLFKRV